MKADDLVPNAIRGRYSAKITTSLLAVFAVTVFVGVLFTLHVLQSGSDGTVSADVAVSGLVGLLIVFMVNLALVGIVLGGNVALELGRLARRAERIGDGELDVDFETDRTDEIGRLYGTFATMRDSLATTLDDLETERERAMEAKRETTRRNEALNADAERFSEVMAACADGDLRHRLDPESENEAMQSIATSFNEMVEELETAVARVSRFAENVDDISSEVQTSAAEVKRASEEVSESMQEISDGSTSQTEDLGVAAEEINDLSATVEEVASTTSTIAERSKSVAELADAGQSAADEATAEMEDAEDSTATVVETIEQFNRDAEQIEEIISLIDEIAEQTNMLALNANIEASRGASGGDDAEGFAVVAREVKELASETQEAVDEVEETLQSIKQGAAASAEEVQAVEDSISTATSTVTGLSDQLTEISRGVSAVDEGIQEIDQATSSQATSAQELATIVESVANVSTETSSQAEQVAAASEESTATISKVSGDVETLDERAERLHEVVDVFEVSQTPVAADGGVDS
jgi:methyl-accepting chemotaxis protein